MGRQRREGLFEKGRLFDIVSLRVRTYSEMALIRGSRPCSLINSVCQRHLNAVEPLCVTTYSKRPRSIMDNSSKMSPSEPSQYNSTFIQVYRAPDVEMPLDQCYSTVKKLKLISLILTHWKVIYSVEIASCIHSLNNLARIFGGIWSWKLDKPLFSLGQK